MQDVSPAIQWLEDEFDRIMRDVQKEYNHQISIETYPSSSGTYSREYLWRWSILTILCRGKDRDRDVNVVQPLMTLKN